jgi:hypothetical protein
MIRSQFIETVVGSPPEGWTLGHLTLQLYRPEERIAVEAWRRGAFAIHERIDSEGNREAVLTHAPTGLRIDSFPTMDDAAECAEKIEPLADWSAISKRFESGSDLYPKIREIAYKIKCMPRLSAVAPAQRNPVEKTGGGA